MSTKGRVTVILPRSELQKLFASDLTVLRAEYEDAEEQLLITVEGEDLEPWQEQCRPMRVLLRDPGLISLRRPA